MHGLQHKPSARAEAFFPRLAPEETCFFPVQPSRKVYVANRNNGRICWCVSVIVAGVIGEKTFKNILIGPDKLPGLSRNGPRGLFLERTGNLSGPVSIFLNVFFADCTVITDMVLGQCFHRSIRF